MNKQELIEKYEKLEGVCKDPGAEIARLIFLEDLRELDEPQKVTIPQFVADWIDNVKRNGLKQKNNFGFFEEITSDSSAYTVMYHIFKEGIATKNIRNWVSDNTDEFARAWLDGYEVEKEKRYYVRFKGMEVGDFNYLNFIKFQRAWVLSSIKLDKKFRTEHTKKQLEEAGFGWVFDCEGIELEEVE